MADRLFTVRFNISANAVSYTINDYKDGHDDIKLYEFELQYADSLIANKLRLAGFIRQEEKTTFYADKPYASMSLLSKSIKGILNTKKRCNMCGRYYISNHSLFGQVCGICEVKLMNVRLIEFSGYNQEDSILTYKKYTQ